MIHRLTYRRTNHDNIHVRGYKEEGTITTPFDMTVLNDLDRFHLVMDAIDRLPQTGDRGLPPSIESGFDTYLLGPPPDIDASDEQPLEAEVDGDLLSLPRMPQ